MLLLLRFFPLHHLKYNSWQNIERTLALWVSDICVGLHMASLWGTLECRKNNMKRSHVSWCICCTTWMKMAETSYFLETTKVTLNMKHFCLKVLRVCFIFWHKLINLTCYAFIIIKCLVLINVDLTQDYIGRKEGLENERSLLIIMLCRNSA